MASYAGIWAEHKNAAGRPYWYNAATKESVWDKPEVLKTPMERALAQTSWKESEANGKKYYYHKESKETRWDLPDEVKQAIEKAEKEAVQTPPPAPLPTPTATSRLTAPNFTSGALLQGANPLSATGGDLSLVQAGAPGPLNVNGSGSFTDPNFPKFSGALPPRPNLPEDPVIPHNGFLTYEEGEKAFFHLLRKAGVDPTWSWEQTMRAIITDPLYKALNTLAEKKAATQKFVDDMKRKEQEEKDARLAKLRPALRNMLKGNPSVFHYSTFATADKLFAKHPIWQQAKIEFERKLIFDEYVNELKDREVRESREARIRSLNKVMNLFKGLGVNALTRWRQAFRMVLDSEPWNEDAELQRLPPLDVLLAFEDFSRVNEREFEEKSRRAAVEKSAKERKAREAFKQLLQEMLDKKQIKAKTPWKTIYPLLAEDARYLEILGNPGSTPLELFWDEVDKLDQVFDVKLEKVEQLMKQMEFDITSASEADFERLVEENGVEDVSEEDKADIYAFLRAQMKRKQAEEQKRAERKQRHLQDDLRYAMKKLDPPIDLDAPYEATEPVIKELPEYGLLEEEGRRAAFAKFVKRQKEKLRELASEDGGSATSRKRKERSRDRPDADREPERDKDSHDRRDSYGKRHRSDTYDKRDRDKDYRERDREHGNRDRDRDRDRGSKKEYRDRERDDGKRGSVSGRHRDYGHRSRDDRDLESRRHQSRERDRMEEDEKPKSTLDKSENGPSQSRGDEGRDDTPEEGEI